MAEQYTEENGAAQYEEVQEGYAEQTFQGEPTDGGAGDASTETPGEKINASKNDDDDRKIFVGGLSWETTVKDMRDYFTKFGEVVDCTLKTDPNTGRSRGFGFVMFTEGSSVDKVVGEKTHMLHGRNIDPKRAKARGGREPIKKVFVGGLDPDTPESTIRDHFSKFGKIEEIDLPYDKIKNQRRAFCFITFESEAVVDSVCETSRQTVGGKEVDVKKATPKNDRGFDGFGRGGRGGGYGGRGGGGSGGRGRGRGGYGGYEGNGWGNQNYDYNNYYNQGYGNYDYTGYGNYGGYDYNNYYNQGWGGYGNQGAYNGQGGYGSGYGSSGYGGQGYDYSGWYGDDEGGQQTTAYKAKGARGGGSATSGYHPYQR